MKIEGLPVIDATSDITTLVNNKDILNAVQGDPRACAIQRSFIRRKEIKDAIVSTTTYIQYVGDDHWTRYKMAPRTRQMVTAFDVVKLFVPGAYDFISPPDSVKLGYRRGKSGKVRGSGGGRHSLGFHARNPLAAK